MFCPNCGTQVTDEAAFCGNCGTRLNPQHKCITVKKKFDFFFRLNVLASSLGALIHKVLIKDKG